MKVSEQEQRILAATLRMLGSGQATAQNLEDYLISYQVLGTLVAIAQGESEMAEATRKVEWAKAFGRYKRGEEKLSDRTAEALADEETADLRRLEVKSRENWMKLKNTRESVWEAIQAIKFLGRMDGRVS